VVAAVALVAVGPIMAVIAASVWWKMGSPVMFTERRAGRNARPFLMRKFRTMTDAVDARGRPLPDGLRVTPLGRVLRRTSLDEIPELLHVLLGEMSLVGPRPLPTRYVERYSESQARRLAVVPGITGLAQVRGRNGLSWDEKFALDGWYVEHQSFVLDLTLLLATARVVVSGDGVSQPGHATMEEFAGPARHRNAGGLSVE
jgi:sugar transferase EpsL